MFKGVNIAEFYTSSKKFTTDQKCCYTLFITDIFFIKNSLKLHLPLCGLHNKERKKNRLQIWIFQLKFVPLQSEIAPVSAPYSSLEPMLVA